MTPLPQGTAGPAGSGCEFKKAHCSSSKLWILHIWASKFQWRPKASQRNPSGTPGRTKGPHRTANASPRALQRDAKGSHTQWWFSQREFNYLYINLKSGKSTLSNLLITCCQQHHFVHRIPNMIPRSIRPVWYHYFGLNIQEMASTQNLNINILWQITIFPNC